MSEKLILKLVKPYLNSDNEIFYDDFDRLFGSLEDTKIIYIYNILEKNGISILDDEPLDEAADEVLEEAEGDVLDEAADEVFEENNNCCSDINQEEKEEISDDFFANYDMECDEDLAVLYQKTDSPFFLERLLEKHIKFIQNRVNLISKQYDHRFDNEELLQIAKIGFMKGCKHFDINKGVKLLTYVAYWIKQELHREITNNGFLIKLPEHVWGKIRKITYGDDIKNKEYDKFINYQQIYLNPSSLDEEGYDNAELIDEISKNAEGFLSSYQDFEKALEEKDLKEFIKCLLKQLTPREKDVIILRFGLGENSHPRTLEEVGMFFGVTRERIRQIELSAKTKMLKALDTQFYSDDEIVQEIKSVLPINFDENYLFKKNGSSYIPELTEMIERVISLNEDEEIDEDELYEQFELCVQQNGYSPQYFNKKEILNKIKQRKKYY